MNLHKYLYYYFSYEYNDDNSGITKIGSSLTYYFCGPEDLQRPLRETRSNWPALIPDIQKQVDLYMARQLRIRQDIFK